MKSRFFQVMVAILGLMAFSACETINDGSDNEDSVDIDVEVLISGAHSVDHTVEVDGDTATLDLDYSEDLFEFVRLNSTDSDEELSEDMPYEFEVEEGESYSFEAVFERTDSLGMSEYLSGGFEDFMEIRLDEYYQPAEGLYGDDLKEALEGVLNEGVSPVSYDGLKTVLEESDEDPENPDNVILIYTRESVKGEWDFPNWNREHVWPQSMFGSADAKTDAHHVVPSDVSENSSRGNMPFSSDETGSYEPHDDVKGDVARMLFYMDARYDNLSLSDNPGGTEMGYLSELLQWHFEDPVDDFERNRNEVIYSHQGNRNPFIDHPHLAWLMYYDHPVVGYESSD
ncbi:MAG: endonuclease I family protein [Bacillota bacterium]